MKSFLSAIQFLTVIPVRLSRVSEKQIALAIVYFPLAGMLLGALLAGAGELFNLWGLPRLTQDVVIIVMLIILTGGMHLDGLSDTFDALLSGKNKEKMLEIMRDSHAGVMGILSIICVLLLKIVFLFSLSLSARSVVLILMCMLSRWSFVFSMSLFGYARQEGKAKLFIQGASKKILFSATIIALIPALLLWRINAALLFAVIAALTYIMGAFVSRKLGGISGDTLGATAEINEVVILLLASFLQEWGLVYG